MRRSVVAAALVLILPLILALVVACSAYSSEDEPRPAASPPIADGGTDASPLPLADASDPAALPTLTVTLAGNGKGSVRSADPGIDCGSKCSQVYPQSSTVALTAMSANGSAFTGWTAPSCGGTGKCEVTLTADVTVIATFSAGVLDVDANKKYEEGDGLIVQRFLFGITGDEMTKDAIGTGATRTSSAAIESYLKAVRPQLDIDDDGKEDALSDGVLVRRYLAGLRGDALTSGAKSPEAKRDTTQIEDYLKTLTPPL